MRASGASKDKVRARTRCSCLRKRGAGSHEVRRAERAKTRCGLAQRCSCLRARGAGSHEVRARTRCSTSTPPFLGVRPNNAA
jgi:hypothetical protein